MTTAPAGPQQRGTRRRPQAWGPTWSLVCAVLAAAPSPDPLLVARLVAGLHLVRGPWARAWDRDGVDARPQEVRPQALGDLAVAVAIALLISPSNLSLLLVAALVWGTVRLSSGREHLALLRLPLTSAARIALPGWLGWSLAKVDGTVKLLESAAGLESALLPWALAGPLLWVCFSAIDVVTLGPEPSIGRTRWRAGLALAAQTGVVLVLAALGAGLAAGIVALLTLVQLPMMRALSDGRLRWFSQAAQPAKLLTLLVAALALALHGA